MMKLKTFYLFTGMVILSTIIPLPAQAANLHGATLSLFWGLPFLGILLSIALLPLFAPSVWHQHFGKITAAWTFAFILCYAIQFTTEQTVYLIAHALLEEYVPFIILLLALFTVSGGILIKGNLHGSARLNTSLLAIGTLLASFMGTTGAAMLLIRPLLRANDNRQHKVHVVIFFIFLVANIGGGLTPLGDPPLFLGFLKGIDFFWTMQNMLLPVLISSLILLTVFYCIDHYYYSHYDLDANDPTPDSQVVIDGKINFLLLLAIVGCVLMSGLWKPNMSFSLLGVDIALENLVRDILLLTIAFVSLKITQPAIRNENEFNWLPMLEIGKLFAGIFVTIVPVIAILRAGSAGQLGGLVELTINSNGEPNNVVYFWLTGLLSSFLDNAPTYLVFFNLADGEPQYLMHQIPITLLAISVGSVFMGAVTYIGNAPNFMVRSIAVQQGIAMPSFFGYMRWSVIFLFPVFILITLLFFIP